MPELIVAHYTENLNWLRNLPKELQITVYDKSPDHSAGLNTIPLPNVGREAHTYLYHIVNNYDKLTDWTIFCQGKPFDHAYDFKKTLREFVTTGVKLASGQEQNQDFHWLGHLIDTDDYQGHRLFRPWSKNEDTRGLDLRGFHRALFDTDGPDFYTFVLGAQFAIHRNLIQQKSVQFYERALDVSITFPDAAHCFERSWDRVFGIVGIDPEWLSGRLMVRLKQMKHQPSSELLDIPTNNA
jgi:hypothetical protein